MSSPAARRMSAAARVSIVLAGLASLAAPAVYGLLSAPAIGAPAAVQASPLPSPPAQTPAATSTPTTPAAATTPTSSAAEIERRQYEQSRPQKEVPFNPADFDKYAGYYGPGEPNNFAHVYRTGNRYFLQLTGQPPVEFFPESPTEFFTTAVAAQMSFTIGADGRVTGMVIHQFGTLIPFPKSSKAGFDADHAAVAKRIQDNTPSPGTRALVLEYIQELEQGRENYDTMTPELAAIARPQLAQATALVRKQGAFESLAFQRVAPNGGNVYIATFTQGKLLWFIMPLTNDGKVSGIFFRPYPP